MRKFPKIIDLIILIIINIFLFNYTWYISLIISLSLFLGYYAFRSYDLETMNSLNESIIRIFAGFLLGSVILLFFYPIFLENNINRNTFINNLFISLLILPLLHKLEYQLFEKHAKPKRYLVIGRENEIGQVLNELGEKTLNKLQFIDYINPSPVKLDELVSEGYHAILVTDPKLEEIVKDKLEEYKEMGIEIEYLPNLVEKHLKRIPLEVVKKFKEYYSIIFEQEQYSPAKRLIDIIGSIIALIIFSPFMILTSVLIYIEDRKPIVFNQKRVGLNERPFNMVKFRSMKNIKTDGPKFADDEKDRILKVGRLIRPIRIDETLQFINILKGDMSLVGPRPEQIPFVKEFNRNIPFYYARHKVKPGLTGWAQIMFKYASSQEDTKIKLSYDLYYVKNRNTLFDLRIILQTLEAVFWKRGAK
ncbi:exopolysaccharide biosynthesis polyprenyl glycosylphosphotransferase [Marinitoga aeolica]|uniref:Exopolysaccharide biosynthesis polyprenyl glycosylphosphotransferase n=1 Tax=Marinitoga aeolica TaxID=2809031 RepID=A0ABY8PTU8_9BACT|nr:exopolysaccharide biosynthesis polyprenyl glycosylphosphotransferase [Marinitoga aeolica]WGS66042.1 exopolysaccharide biosynthesis polyprenyl glycosylphosphotransferase [Marinitoga aeolica]